MARIPDEEIERLKREVSIERLAEARGVKLKRHGADLIGLCPFHEDHSPSLVISPKKNLWNCLGACRRGGDVIEWVMRAEGVSFRHAVELLREDHFLLAASSRPVKSSSVPKLPAPVSRDADDRALLLQVASYYHETLKGTPEALKYLEARGLKSPEMIEHFRMGFANRTLGYRLPEKNRAAGAELRGRLAKVGILRESGHEHFNGSVVIPVFNLAGEVVEMYGRKITRGLRENTPLHLYLPGPRRGVWNEEALVASKEVILCEALIDALTFWCAGYRHVTASYGINGFTDDHRASLRKHGTKRIYIAYDRDDAGERAAQSLAEELLAMGMECFRVQFPKGMDANEYALKVQPAAKSLGIVLNKAEWLGKGQRPTVAMSEGKLEEAAKEKITEPIEANTEEQSDLPLAAESAPPLSLAVSPTSDVPVEVNGEEITITQGDRRYRVLGLEKNTSLGMLRVNVLVTRGESLHVDTFDLYSSRHRMLYAKQAGEELGVKEEVVGRDLGRVLLKLEDLQREQLKKTLEPGKEEIQLTEEERAAALGLLRDPNLLGHILADFERCGVVGEETNKKVSYLATVSRLLPAPLAVVVQSSSAAGKSSLMEAVLGFLPEEQRVQYSTMTGQSLFYMGETDLKNKVLAIVEEEGAQRAAYALKLLQSEGVLTIASTGKDATTGRLITHQYRVEGPVMIFLTTTAVDVDEELLNRCLVLTVDEDRTQTQAIHKKQREAQTLEGLWARQERAEVLRVHRNAQRLLKPIAVVNDQVRDLVFPDRMTRTRRDHMKFLTLINTIALLHQHQRPIRTDTRNGKTLEYIEATAEDVKLAWELASDVLVRSLDELQPQTKRLLLLLDEMVSEQCQQLKMERSDFHFSRREVRQYTAWGDSVLKKHLHRLEELEYLIVHRGGRGQSFVYELYFERDSESGKPVLPGSCHYDEKKSRLEGGWTPSSHRQVAGVARGGHGKESSVLARQNGDFRVNPEKITIPAAKEKTVVQAVVRTVSGVR